MVKHAIPDEAFVKTTRSPSVTADGALLSLKQPESFRGCLPMIPFFQRTFPVEASQHQAMMSFPISASDSNGFRVVKKTFPFETTGVLWPVSGRVIFQAIF